MDQIYIFESYCHWGRIWNCQRDYLVSIERKEYRVNILIPK